MLFSADDEQWMRHALTLAAHAEQQGEVPIGAVLVLDNVLIGEGWNCPISSHDPSAHAEIIALRAAGKKLMNYRIVNTTLYTTLEPCLMCVGALTHARVQRVVYGASDPKKGAVNSLCRLEEAPSLNHRITYQSGLLAAECSVLLNAFFSSRR